MTEYFYYVDALLSCDEDYGNSGIVDGKGRTYRQESIGKLIDDIVDDDAEVLYATKIYYNKTYEQSKSCTRKIKNLVKQEKKRRSHEKGDH
jgi:hypothetical protein